MYFPPFGGAHFQPSTFEQSFHVYPVSFIDKAHLENGDKVIMPPSALDRLASLQIDYPMLFETHNAAANRTSHCGVLEFVAEEGYVYMPYWMMQNLLLREGDIVRLRSAALPKGSYVKLQPHTKDFLDISNPKAVLETTLRSFSCLTTGESILVCYNNKRYFIDVVDARPAAAISIIETDCEVDFAPPLDWVEPERKKDTGKAEAAAAAAAAGGAAGAGAAAGFSLGGSKKGKKKKAEGNKEGKQDAPPPEEPSFTPFVGSGKRLDGRASTPAASASGSSPAAPAGLDKGKAPATTAEAASPAKQQEQQAPGNGAVATTGGKLVFGSGDGASKPAVAKGKKKKDTAKTEEEPPKPSFQAFSGKGYSLK